mmetsp:Transcript_27431/g.50952  ORF Transcript_27431/g.50952 Transcript_27431/m.50952 type:complete len:128 (-) Transcript_27431:70-453(-)
MLPQQEFEARGAAQSRTTQTMARAKNIVAVCASLGSSHQRWSCERGLLRGTGGNNTVHILNHGVHEVVVAGDVSLWEGSGNQQRSRRRLVASQNLWKSACSGLSQELTSPQSCYLFIIFGGAVDKRT